jgi:glutamyl-tRNA synthetase
VNNTPRQINIFRAFGKEPPIYAHLPTVLTEVIDEQGEKHVEKMSKRHGAKPVTQYRDEGYLPDAMVNYLARLGWSHGDDEIFSRAQFLEWFNLDHLGRSAAQFDEAKLRWVNAQHLKAMADEPLAALVAAQLHKRGIVADERLPQICALFKDRCDTTVILADWAARFYADAVEIQPEDRAQHLTDAVKPVLTQLAEKLLVLVTWDKAAIAAAIKDVLAENKAQGLKMPQLAMPVRVLVLGTPQTPSLDAVLALLPREKVLARLQKV